MRHSLGRTWITVYRVLHEVGDPNLRNRLRNWTEFDAYVEPGSNAEREFIELLRSMASNQVPWSDLFKNGAFLKPEPKTTVELDIDFATTLAWRGTFKGDLANVLLETIADCLSKDKVRTPYGGLSCIVNSSGTGKSRMVDQLGTEVITVPMCLRPGIRGMPPPDRKLRGWLVSPIDDRTTVQNMLYGFACSLLVVTLRKLKTIVSEKQDIAQLPSLDSTSAQQSSKEKPKDYVSLVMDRHRRLAAAFRECMTAGQSFHASNSYRETFYDEVVKLAEKFAENSAQVRSENELEYDQYVSGGEGLHQAGESLCRFIDEHKVLEPDEGPRRPLVVLAFDEAHILTSNPPDQNDWNLFSELGRILGQIQDLPIFSLFLSTAGCFKILSDSSAWAREPDNCSLNLISEISFDDIAYPALEGTVKIDRVVGIDWISHLGRPLFGSYWDKLPRQLKHGSLIMDYAMQKLLNGPNELRDSNPAGTLACLSVRFALEFNMDGSARDVSYVQVEKHMRLCIAATAGFEKLITIPGSEPLLAEAAYLLLKDTRRNAVRHLANHLDLNCIDRGRRGELVATLLIMQTYDAARAISGRRWVSVVNFMEALLPASNYEMLLQSGPTSWPMEGGSMKQDSTFRAIFEDYGMWFNHVIKIERKELISIDHLWKYVMRGAMILCATNQEGIDIVLPICHTTQNLGPDSVTAVVIQVKNAWDYKATLKPSSFDAMDFMVKSAIFSKLRLSDSDSESTLELKTTEPAEPKKKKRKVDLRPREVVPDLEVVPKPVIRVVFALASPEPAVIFKEQPEAKHPFDGFTTFDIWLAGLSHETFRQIQEVDLESYKILLERSLMPHDAFKLKDEPNVGEKARKGKGACRQRMVPLAHLGCSHHAIHLPGPKNQERGLEYI
ncbi:uncharacterized protein EI90DRAFT_3037372 [Cantharellus anzutake]|uniref:uncharacterized protein n=1 Tax=Cantharellus anzutake TaxID=1750568 RepID=UPI001906AD0E|nr:uncharacterized protein EI90DRAFT_3037372 [Cantharellus anzutake]KAF8339651.1 hypothetical protein EI90DRAFT_3037372 [Cantharellus anzutake]